MCKRCLMFSSCNLHTRRTKCLYTTHKVRHPCTTWKPLWRKQINHLSELLLHFTLKELELSTSITGYLQEIAVVKQFFSITSTDIEGAKGSTAYPPPCWKIWIQTSGSNHHYICSYILIWSLHYIHQTAWSACSLISCTKCFIKGWKSPSASTGK